MYIQATTYKIKDFTVDQAAKLWHEFDPYLEGTGVTMRLYRSYTGDRPVFLIVMAAESLDAIAHPGANISPEVFAAWHAKWEAIRIPNTRHDQIWEEV